MNKKEFLNQIKKFYYNNINISEKKNSDYATNNDPFKNFKLCEYLGICSTEVGILVRMCDKISRISNLIERNESVEDEKIEDTLSDLSNYAAILDTYLKQKK